MSKTNKGRQSPDVKQSRPLAKDGEDDDDSDDDRIKRLIDDHFKSMRPSEKSD